MTRSRAAGRTHPTPYGLKIDEEGENYAESKGAAPTTATAPAAAAQQLLRGRWVNTADGQEQVELTPTHYKTYYEGELLVEENMEFHGVCPDACSGGGKYGQALLYDLRTGADGLLRHRAPG